MQIKYPDDWEIKTSTDYCSSIADGTHDTPKPVENGVPLYTSKNLSDKNKLDKTNAYHISIKDMVEINKRSYVNKYDILICHTGSNVGELIKLRVALPKDIHEQELIGELLYSIDRKITTEKDILFKMSQLKQGLMQYLLTGKVRVKV